MAAEIEHPGIEAVLGQVGRETAQMPPFEKVPWVRRTGA